MKIERSELKINTEIISLISSVVVGILTLIGVIYNSKKTQSKNEALIEARMGKIEELNALHYKQIEERIDNLSILQTKHNNLMERTFQLEKGEAELNRSMKSAFNTLDEVKSDVRDVRSSVNKLDEQVTDIKLAGARLEEKLNKDK